ncbi:hypothetical protein E3226_008265 [Legionella geestiana]|uniref:hypothetical protein n=1 Tax=Legionella geestiana TaxID=45065 RepID=UPI0010923B1E|nr:hypothetical protein [Legionella geestiana]QDQ40385.1 hypothetical protein E3226_008265 [Legionella geestiana]
MNDKLQAILNSVFPFMIAGVGIAMAIAVLIFFYNVIIWGILIGAVLWAGVFIKNLLMPEALNTPKSRSKGRIIEHEKD